VYECCRLKFGREARSVEEGADFDRQFVIVDFGGTILRGTIQSSGLDYVLELLLEHVAE